VTTTAFNWLEIGRRLARDEQFRSANVQVRRKFLKEQGAALKKEHLTSKKLAVHTLQRIANVAMFVDEKLDQEIDWSSKPIATIEVIMRISKIDATAAYKLLARLQSGDLSFRTALGEETSLRKGQGNDNRQPNRKINRSKDILRATIKSAWEISNPDDLLWIEPRADWRYSIVKSHGVFLGPFERSACYFDAGLLASGLNHRRIMDEFIREVLAACALFTIVLAFVTETEDADRFLSVFEKSDNKPRNLTVLVQSEILQSIS
jgi:hypothetical protein